MGGNRGMEDGSEGWERTGKEDGAEDVKSEKYEEDEENGEPHLRL